MSQTLRGAHGELHLSWNRDLQRLDRARAVAMLRGVGNESGGMNVLRQLLAEGLGPSVERMDDAAVIDQLADRIGSGQVVALLRRSSGGTWTERVVVAPPPEEPLPEATPLVEEEEEQHWLQIKLVDDEGNPMAGERYKVTLPDGTVLEGKLGADGMARVDGIDDPGKAVVSFPDQEEERRLA